MKEGQHGGAGERHFEEFYPLASEIERELRGPDQVAWIRRLRESEESLRAALEWSLRAANDPRRGVELAIALGRFWILEDQFAEGREWLTLAVARSEAAPASLRAKALNGAALFAWEEGDFDASSALCEAAVEAGQAADDPLAVARARYTQGHIASGQGDLLLARQRYEESLSLREIAGDETATADSLHALGIVTVSAGDPEKARVYYEQSLTLRRRLGEPTGLARALLNLGYVCRKLGDRQATGACYRESLAICARLDHPATTLCALYGLGYVAAEDGDFRTMARLFGAVDALRESAGLPLPTGEAEEYDRSLAAARAASDPLLLEASWSEGRSMALSQIVESIAGAPQWVPRSEGGPAG